jgi:fucose permease
LVLSRGLWKKAETDTGAKEENPATNISQALGRPGAAFSMCAFFCYVSYEMTAGLWASSYLSSVKGMSAAGAAGWAAFIYGGITIGRFLSGFLTKRLTSRQMILYGCAISLFGVLIMALPLPAGFTVAGLLLLGFGCGPYYPTMISETPRRFGKSYSSIMIGLQMGCAYIGSMLIPSLTGWLSAVLTLGAFPWILMVFGAGALIFGEKSGRFVNG